MTRVFKFIKDVQHEPAAQMVGHRKGEVLIEGDGITVSGRGSRLILRTGHGTSDDFKIGEEVVELSSEEARPYIRARGLAKLTAEEIDAL